MNLIVKIAFFVLVDYISTDPNLLQDSPAKNQYVNAFYQRCGAVCNAKFCNVSYTCRPVNRTSKLKQLDLNFHENVKLKGPIYLRITAYKKFATQYRSHMIDVKFEFCQQMLLKTHPIFSFFVSPDKNSNLLTPCPISGHRNLGPSYTDTWIGHLVPVGEWRLDFILTKIINGSDQHLFTISDYYLVKPTGATEF